MSHNGHITEDKIKELGRAIASKSDMLLEAYLARTPIPDHGHTKNHHLLRDFGVITERDGGVQLTSEMVNIFDVIAKKTHRMQVMPDIEEWKRNIQHFSKLALNASYEMDESENEQGYLDDVEHYVHGLGMALNEEMASIEYIINSQLSDTVNLKSKRMTLNMLVQRIKSQIEKLQSLSREQLHKCHAGNYKVAVILNGSICRVIDKCLDEMNNNLSKTVEMVDRLEKERKRQTDMLWRLHHQIRNQQYIPKDISLSFEDLVDNGLAVSGIDLIESPSNTEIEDNKYFLLTVLDKISSNGSSQRKPLKTDSSYTGDIQEMGKTEVNEEFSEAKNWAYSFLEYNSTDIESKRLAASEFWGQFELRNIIEYKAFLAMVLHLCKSDFQQDNLVHTELGYAWRLYLKTAKPSDICDTIYVQDARYVRYEIINGEPSKDVVWKRN